MDLFVRKDNKLAVSLYEKLDYCVYRHILQYYSDSYDAYGMLIEYKSDVLDMRKAFPKDVEKKTLIKPYSGPIHYTKIHSTL